MIQKSSLPDPLITLPIIFLLSLSILIIYSSDPRLAFQQGTIAVFGLLLYWMLSFVDVEYYRRYANISYLIILILLLVVFIVGVETRGSLRWVQFGGWQFQPSEFAKPILILFLAKFWSEHRPSWKNIITSLLLILPMVGLIFKQPDLGTVLTLITIWIVMLIGANVPGLKLMIMGLAGCLLAPIIWASLKDYQKTRILSFLSPDQDPLGGGYNVIQSIIAVGSGGIFGRGLGRGTQSRLQFLPEFRTDFVFASIAEELGFIAAVLVLTIYGVIIIRSFKIISFNHDRYSNLLIFGVLGMVFFQVVVNIGMNIGIIPVTGITLPLLSVGGSSVIAILVSLSFITAVSRCSHLVDRKSLSG